MVEQEDLSSKLLDKDQSVGIPVVKTIKYEKILESELNRACSLLLGHTDPVTSISMSVDNSHLVSCSAAGDVKFWDLINREEIWTKNVVSDTPNEFLKSICFISEKYSVIAAAESGNFYYVDSKNKFFIKKENDSKILKIVSDSNSYLFSLHEGGHIKRWSLLTSASGNDFASAEKFPINFDFDVKLGEELEATSIKLVLDWLYIGCKNGKVLRCQIIKCELEELTSIDETVNCLAVNPSGTQMVIGSNNNIFFFNITSKKLIRIEDNQEIFTHVAYTNKGQMVICACQSKKIILLNSKEKDVESKDQTMKDLQENVFLHHHDTINEILVTHDYKYFITCSNDRTIKFIQKEQVRDTKCSLKVPENTKFMNINKKIGTLVAIDDQDRVNVFKINENRQVHRYNPKNFEVQKSFLTKDGKYLIIVLESGDQEEESEMIDDYEYDYDFDSNYSYSDQYGQSDDDEDQINYGENDSQIGENDEKSSKHDSNSEDKELEDRASDDHESSKKSKSDRNSNADKTRFKLTLFDLDENAISSELKAEEMLLSFASSEESKYLYAAGESYLYKYDLSTKERIKEKYQFEGNDPIIKLSSDDKFLYYTNSTEINQIDPVNLQLIDSFSDRNEGLIKSLILKSDDSMLISGHENGKFIFWSLPNKQILYSNSDLQSSIDFMLLSQNEEFLVIMTDERDIYKISLSEKSPKIISESIDFYFTSLELFDNSTLIFGVDGRIVFWNINDEKEISSINAHGDDIHYLDHFENYFVSVSQNCCKMWDMNTKSQELLIYGYCEEITSVFMYDEELIVIGMENGAIAVYSTTEKKLINNCFNHSGRVDYIDCLNGIYATGCSDGVVVTGDLRTNQSHTYNNPYSYVKDVKLSNTHVFCVAGDDIAFWKLESNDLPVLFSNGYDSTSKIILYSEGQFLASGSSYGTVRFWKIEDQSQLKILNEQPEISALALSEDENFLFAGSSTGFIGVYSTISRDFMCKLEGHSEKITFLQVFNRVLFSISDDKIIKTWPLKEKKEFYSFRWRTDTPTHLVLSGDSKYLATGYDKGAIRVYDFATSKFLDTINIHGEEPITGLLYSKDSKFLVTAATNSSITLVEAINQKNKETIEIPESKNSTSPIVLSNHNLFLASAMKDFSISIWRFSESFLSEKINKSPKTITLSGHTKEINDLKFSHEENFLFSCSKDYFINKWDIESKSKIISTKQNDSVSFLLILSHSDQLISISDNKKVKLCTIEFGEKKEIKANDLTELKDEASTVCLSKDEKSVFIGNNSGDIHEYSLPDMKNPKSLEKTHIDKITNLCLSSHGNTLYSSSLDKLIISWDLRNENSSKKCLRPTSGVIMCILIDDRGEKVFTGSDSSTINVFNFKEKKELACILGHIKTVTCLGICSEKQWLVSGSLDENLRVHSTHDYSFKLSIPLKLPIKSLVILPDNDRVLTGHDNGNVKISSLTKKVEIIKYEISKSCINCLKLLPGAELKLLSSSQENVIKLWDLSDKNQDSNIIKPNPTIFSGHSEGVLSLAILNQNSFISGGQDSQIKVWSIQKKREDFTLNGHEGSVNSLALTEDKTKIISAGSDCVINIWDLKKRVVEHSLDSSEKPFQDLAVFANSFLISAAKDRALKIWRLNDLIDQDSMKTTSQKYNVVIKTEDEKILLNYKYGHCESIDKKKNNELVRLNQIGISETFDPYYQNLILFYNLIDSIAGNAFVNLKLETNQILFSRFSYSVLHILCYKGDAQSIERMNDENLNLTADFFGKSPLFYGIQRQNQGCVDTVLRFLIDLPNQSDSSRLTTSFSAISNDLPVIISNSSKILHLLIGQFFIKSPVQFEKMKNLPHFFYSDNFMPVAQDFNPSTSDDDEKIPVVINYTPFKIPFNPGSTATIEFLKSISECSNRQIFNTPFVKFVVRKHWDELIFWTSGYTFLIFINLILLVILFSQADITSSYILYIFLFVNFWLFLWEVIQFLEEKLNYLKDFWNYIDILRLSTTILWIVLRIQTPEVDYNNLEWVVALINFTRGLTGFRLFSGTRYYVKLIIRAISDMLYFLVILTYSIITFGVMFEVSRKEKNFEFRSLWMDSYLLNFGTFEAKDEFAPSFETFAYILATVINVILMFNLLISILSESFANFQTDREIIDYTERISVVLEIQKLMFWVDRNPILSYFQVMTYNSVDDSSEENDEKIEKLDKQIKDLSLVVEKQENEIKNQLNNFSKLNQETYQKVEGKIENCGNDIKSLQGKIDDIGKKVEELGDDVKKILTALAGKSDNN